MTAAIFIVIVINGVRVCSVFGHMNTISLPNLLIVPIYRCFSKLCIGTFLVCIMLWGFLFCSNKHLLHYMCMQNCRGGPATAAVKATVKALQLQR